MNEELRNVTDFAGELVCSCTVHRVIGEELLVLFQRRAATGGVGDDGVEPSYALRALEGRLLAEKGFKVGAGEALGEVAEAGVDVERAAAELPGGHDDFAAIHSQDAEGGAVQFCEGRLGDAAGEEGHAGPPTPCRLRRVHATQLGEKEVVVQRRQQLLRFAELAEKFQRARSPCRLLQAGALIETQQAADEGEARGVGKQLAKAEPAQEAGDERAAVVLLNLRAGGFDELAVLDAGGAGGLAGAAVEAEVNVADEALAELQAAFVDQNHLVDAAARRVHLDAE